MLWKSFKNKKTHLDIQNHAKREFEFIVIKEKGALVAKKYILKSNELSVENVEYQLPYSSRGTVQNFPAHSVTTHL